MTSRAVVAVALLLLLLPGGAVAQRSFDFSAGGSWGGHAPDGPVAAGWVQSSRLLDQWVLKGTSRVDTVFEGRGLDFDGGDVMTYESDTVDIEAENARCGTFGGDGTFASPCDPPFPAGETAYGFVLQPGVGVNLWGPDFDLPLLSLAELGFRIAADLPILANRDHVEVRPRMAVVLVVGFGP